MKVNQKSYETWCNEHCKLLKNNWELYSQASYGYITGVQTFKNKLVEHLHKRYDPHCGDYFVSINHMIEMIEKFGEDKVEVDIEDHQLGPKSTDGLAQDS